MTPLPQELLDHIFQYLPVSDVGSVLKACLIRKGNRSSHSCEDGGSQDVRTVKRAVDDRINPQSFFRGWFKNTAQMVECLSRTGTVLIGPRAFDYFARESFPHCEETWDFLTPWCPGGVLDILLTLSRAGVTWETPLGRASRQLQGCSVCQEDFRNAALAQAVNGETLDVASTLQALSECKLHERLGVLSSVRGLALDGKTPVILHIQARGNTEADRNVLTAPFRVLCDVRFDHLQCMVAGYMAVQKNVGATKDKEAISRLQELTDSLAQSFMPHSHRIEQRHRAHGALRALADTGSLCINLTRFSRIDMEVAPSAYQICSNTARNELKGECTAISNVMDSTVKDRSCPLVHRYRGRHSGQGVADLVGMANHTFNQVDSLLILRSDYGVANDWVREAESQYGMKSQIRS